MAQAAWLRGELDRRRQLAVLGAWAATAAARKHRRAAALAALGAAARRALFQRSFCALGSAARAAALLRGALRAWRAQAVALSLRRRAGAALARAARLRLLRAALVAWRRRAGVAAAARRAAARCRRQLAAAALGALRAYAARRAHARSLAERAERFRTRRALAALWWGCCLAQQRRLLRATAEAWRWRRLAARTLAAWRPATAAAAAQDAAALVAAAAACRERALRGAMAAWQACMAWGRAEGAAAAHGARRATQRSLLRWRALTASSARVHSLGSSDGEAWERLCLAGVPGCAAEARASHDELPGHQDHAVQWHGLEGGQQHSAERGGGSAHRLAELVRRRQGRALSPSQDPGGQPSGRGGQEQLPRCRTTGVAGDTACETARSEESPTQFGSSPLQPQAGRPMCASPAGAAAGAAGTSCGLEAAELQRRLQVSTIMLEARTLALPLATARLAVARRRGAARRAFRPWMPFVHHVQVWSPPVAPGEAFAASASRSQANAKTRCCLQFCAAP